MTPESSSSSSHESHVPTHGTSAIFHDLLGQFFQQAREALVWIHDDRIVALNDAALELFRCDRQALLDRPFHEILAPPEGASLRVDKTQTEKGVWRCIGEGGLTFDARVRIHGALAAKRDFLLAIEKIPLADDPESRRANFEKLLVDVFGLVSIVRDKGHLFKRCLELLGKTFGIERAVLVHLDSGHGAEPVLHQWRGLKSHAHTPAMVDYLTDFAGWTEWLERSGHMAIADTQSDGIAPPADILARAGIHSFLAAAMFVQNGFAGFLALENRNSRRWSGEEIRILKTTARILSAAIESIHVEKTLRESRRQLYQAQKMEALGTLVAGVAHEVNNPMNLILYNIDILKKIWNDVRPLLNDPATAANYPKFGGLDRRFVVENLPRLLSDADAAAERVVNIVAELKRFARHGDAFEKKPVQLNEAVTGAIRLCEVTLKKAGVHIATTLDPNLPIIFGNIQSLEQIIVNLVINAAEAMAGSPGQVVVITEWNRESDHVRLRVSDTGGGVDPRVSKKLFDPFVTTKQESGGTGLGLSVTYNLVETHGATISFAPNAAGKGTTFTVTFPTQKQQALVMEPLDGIDALTGCFSQGYINKRLPLEIKRAARYHHGLSLILCEVQRQRRGGHPSEGGFDLSVLKEFADYISRQIRTEIDWMARTDSGRFFIALPETDLAGAKRLAERLHEKFTQKRFGNRRGAYGIEARFGITGINSRTVTSDISAAAIIDMVQSCLERTLQEGHPPVESCMYKESKVSLS